MPNLHRLATACAVLAAFTAAASAKIERTVEKTFQVQPGVHLTVSTYGGEIRVDPSSDGVVKVVAKEHFHADSEAEADEIMRKVDLTIEQHGNDVVATAVSRNNIGFHFGWSHDVQIDFVITVPSSTSVDLKTSGGDIAVGDLGGSVNAHTSGGEVRLGKISGDIEASTSGGDVELADGRGSVKLSTSGGNVSAGHLTGPSTLKTSGGDIKVDSVENTLDAETSGGNVRAGFYGPLKGDCSLSTSGGEVKATVGAAVGFHLDAKTSGGDVNAAGVTITIDRGGMGKSTLAGDVNGGGPLLRLRSSGGDIEVIPRRS
ncbi:MAG TPA: DUF4097 family beta strand repeat-containing protein [Opitutaceae bacterium]